MKRILFALLAVMLLTACGGGGGGTAKKTAKNTEPLGDYSLEDEFDDATIINEIIAEDDFFKGVLISVRSLKAGEGVSAQIENRARLYFENKSDKVIYFKINDLYVDGVEMDDYEFGAYLEVGESETELLRTFDYVGDLPALEKSIAFTLRVLDDETYDVLNSHEVEVEF